ncbi:hypothetical protein Ait01nite_082340 [Actinoplanes italicus]|uniref:Uncharacterized protein n=1 Tax=Actinoplanes italicus TaxID=113567 RepID=A0A2T0K312_9ACTN|nr:hypothetical protein [Actinoplanes italicus]PRX17253.1 hypothetical protein CLV67_11629 [Actinoplanes italicus]GIE35189.1 hypothetical protein Ait01nite_082340 [Actinoplanes italicus]
MGASQGRAIRSEIGQVSGVQRTPNSPPGNLYASRSARNRPDGTAGTGRLRRLASEGRLAQAAADARGYDRQQLTSAAYELVWPLVFNRLTRRLEQQRGHAACAAGVAELADECLDRFHDDVEAVVEDLLVHARKPIQNLDAWVTTRLGAATVNAHRRRRGVRGALQRPRLPVWLIDELGDDRWLRTLATNILVWVGVTDTAGAEVWPLDSWAQERAGILGDWPGSDRITVEREITQVLRAMQVRPSWYESFVERPLGTKRAPVAPMVANVYGEPANPLVLGAPDDPVEAELVRLAQAAVRAIGLRVTAGEEAGPTVVEVIGTVFGGLSTGTLDRAPHGAHDPLEGVSGALADQRRVERIVRTVQSIIDEHPGTDAG